VVKETVAQEGYSIQKLEFEAAGGVRFPALLFEPAGRRQAAAILLANGQGKAAEGGEIQEWVRLGHVVLAVDPRGMGEGIPRRAGGGYTPAYQVAARAWLLGQHVAGYQVADLRQAFAFLKSRGRVVLMAKGAAGPIGLLAAALEPEIAAVAVERSILSYTQFVEAPMHEGLTGVVIPGVLKHTDLPELRHLLVGRPVWVVSPVTPTGAPVLPKDGARVYPWARVVERPEGHAAAKVYRELLVAP
jgi:pimeloyl-ACP methyl ester carboxylesterase